MTGRAPHSTRNAERVSIERLERTNAELMSSNAELRSFCEKAEKLLEQQADKHRQVEDELRQAIVQRDRFFATLSHELRNPIAAMLNASCLCKETDADVALRDEAVEVIETQLVEVSRLLNDLIDVSRFTNGKLNLQTEPIDLGRMTDSILRCVQHRIDASEQTLHVQVDEEPIYVMADRGRLQQAVVNLLLNASNYSPPNYAIWYSLEREGHDAVLAIRDEGHGIPPHLVPDIFDPFVQCHQAVGRNEGGMGLGLPLVKAIAEAHHGRVLVESQGIDRGSRFELRIPLTDNRPIDSTDTDSETIGSSGCRVLLVEDNDGNRRMLARSLEIKGFEVLTAANGETGLNAAIRGKPDVAVVDIGLPDVNGYEFARLLRADQRHNQLTLIAVTGHGRSEDKKRAYEAGFNLHMVKPVDPTRLMSAIIESTRSCSTQNSD